MIDKELLRSVIEDKLSQTDCFLVSLSVSSTNSIVMAIDSVTSVSLDFCIELTQYIEQKFDRNAEDYSLEVGSYSISEPFVDSRQYVKNIGRTIEILTLEHKKIRGILLKADSRTLVFMPKAAIYKNYSLISRFGRIYRRDRSKRTARRAKTKNYRNPTNLACIQRCEIY